MPPGLPGAGRFLPGGALGALEFLKLSAIAAQLEGAGEFVRVRVGGIEFRARAQIGNVVRGTLGALQAADIRAAGGTAAQVDRKISEKVNAQFSALEGEAFDAEIGALLEGAEDALLSGDISFTPE